MRDFWTNRYFYFLGGGILIALTIFLTWGSPRNFPISSNFAVSEGWVLTDVALELKEANFIKSPISFQFFAILFGGDRHIVAGDYFFDRPVSVFTVAWRISFGHYNQKGVRVTIQEGKNAGEIAQILSEQLNKFDATLFEILAQREEGYLFPDTYYFFPSIKSKDVIQVMKNNFDEKIKLLRSEIENGDRTLSEIITMASIIEREAGPSDDRSIISGILWKRLKEGMRLEVDVEPKTYKYYGLPERPIGNPGLLSIEAALRPKDSSYYYYIHEDGQKIHYAKTFDEHRANIRKYLR